MCARTHCRYTGELHVTIVATGFGQDFAESLMRGADAARKRQRRGTAAAAAAAPVVRGADDGEVQGAAGGAAEGWGGPRQLFGRTLF
jgi:hypothetical protein